MEDSVSVMLESEEDEDDTFVFYSEIINFERLRIKYIYML